MSMADEKVVIDAVDEAGEDELTTEKIAQYVKTLSSIPEDEFAAPPKVDSFCYAKVKRIYIKGKNARSEWLMWNGFDLPVDVEMTFKATNYNLNGPETQKATIPPYGVVKLASIARDDPYQGASFSYSGDANLHSDAETTVKVAVAQREVFDNDFNTFLEKTGLSAGKANAHSEADLIALCEENGVRYFDSDFPANLDAILPASENNPPFPNIMFKRPADLLTGTFHLYDGIDPNDVGQGRLGDCWLCCSISSLAEDPALVKRIFNTAGANRQGVYDITLYPLGEPTRLLIDDLLPAIPGQGLVFMHHDNNDPEGADELWPMLLEKAYARLCGGYLALKSGQPSEAFSTLTGFPVMFYDEATWSGMSDDEMWTLLLTVSQQNQVCTVSTSGVDEKTEKGDTEGNGIVAGHAYSLLDAQQVGPNRIIQTRNPWGHFEWDGDWGDHSSLWTDAYKEQVGFEEKDDGMFWMNLADFRKTFDEFTVCHKYDSLRRPWNHFNSQELFEGTNLLPQHEFEINITTSSTESWLGLLQPYPRYHGFGPTDSINVGLVVLDQNGALVGEIALSHSSQIWIPIKLSIGVYRVIVYSAGVRRKYLDYSAHSRVGVSFMTSDPCATWTENPSSGSLDEIIAAFARDVTVNQTPGTLDTFTGLGCGDNSLIFKHEPKGCRAFTYAASLNADAAKAQTIMFELKPQPNSVYGSHTGSNIVNIVLFPGESKLLHFIGQTNLQGGGGSFSVTWRKGFANDEEVAAELNARVALAASEGKAATRAAATAEEYQTKLLSAHAGDAAKEAEQASGCLELSGHPVSSFNSHPFYHSKSQPEVNGHPHFENDNYHLYYAKDAWRFSGSVKPDSTASISYHDMANAASTVVPEGEANWTTWFDGKWQDFTVTITHVTEATLAARKAELQRLQEEQASGSLEVTGHFVDSLNDTYIRSESEPNVNEHPHFESKNYHLYFAKDAWRLSSAVKADSSACISFFDMDEAKFPTVPEGESKWTSWKDDAWQELPIVITHVTAEEVAERKLAIQREIEIQASATLVFANHPLSYIQGKAFTRSVADPEANGFAHYEDEDQRFHLFYGKNYWRISNNFTPDSGACMCQVAPTKSGLVPEKAIWSVYLDNAWQELEVEVNVVTE